jgi:ankyrin repeat protein
MTKALLDKGADPNIRFRNLGELPTRPKTETALILAAQNGTVEVVRLLLAHGANASAQDADGRAPLTAAIRVRSLRSS